MLPNDFKDTGKADLIGKNDLQISIRRCDLAEVNSVPLCKQFSKNVAFLI